MRNLSLFVDKNAVSFVPTNQPMQQIINKDKLLPESEYIVAHYKKIFGILQRKHLLNSCAASYTIRNLSDEDLTTILLETFSGEVVTVSDIYQILIEAIYPMYRPQIRKIIKILIERKYVKEVTIITSKMLMFKIIDFNKANLLKYI